ncbi:Rha family transcriptional regulator [Acinetobacter lwoffii]|uniref:phage regulatory CII family protein n=1 Tax=Acinetobacter lwoffii TaxID=28090 RepID=UPI0015822604|nr:phage regulatory CII family protein [Acinetobacter lwoffii]QKT99305.1 Rha family transcriptional regulator [Acinetobacter lwoffii]
MINKKDKVLPLSMALRAAVYSDGDQSLISRIAEKNCWNITTFRNSLCPTTTTHKANIYHLEAVLAETKDPRIMDSICAIHGKAAWFELPDLHELTETNFLKKIGNLAKEQGELSQSIAEAIADKSICSDEYDVIHKDVMDLIRVALTLLAMVETHKD